MATIITRRAFVRTLAAAGGATLIGCGRETPEGGGRETSNVTVGSGPGRPQGAAVRQAAQPMPMIVYRDPSCGCCEAWAKLAQESGYKVSLIDRDDMPAIKRKHGVPQSLASCHTALVGGYAIEGHVPLADVARLLNERTPGIKGIAVPGMPRGSPGMEMPDGAKDAFEVIAFDGAGTTRSFNVG